MTAADPPTTLVPKLWLVLRQGYGCRDLQADALAGLTVAVVALPLSMALAIASGTTPDKGLITAVVAGLVISLLGGSRVQIGGPTGAFVVIVSGVITQHGYAGLVAASLMAGLILCAAAVLRLGRFVHRVPEPVIAGFTTGIAIIIGVSQLPDALGLHLPKSAAEVVPKLAALSERASQIAPAALLMTLGAILAIELMKRFAPKLPSLLLVTAGAAALALALRLPVETIASRFGALPRTLPVPRLPDLSPALMLSMAPAAFNIAFLAGIESLLSAKVADAMTGGRHRANAELMAQGVANVASALFGGLPATGAIARTATNIRAGARSPLAGVFHSAFVMIAMLLFAPLMGLAPMPALAAILLIVAWNMGEAHRLPAVLRGPWPEAAVLFVTLILTVTASLTVAIFTGIALELGLSWLRRRRGASAG